ncbi:MAG TPA: anaerobic ribonucleoside-triphosphate reductase activating protein [Candidatus Pacearchaeota archaeon]|nr:anaerobic ribonucleoside-triphosphate reductase activating protein [Candidatus Pacearchaeota archaeon]HOK94319.1 anaerobic ribonucleoside-triphosphate reductase activating protein [Candidatus Pacearchaeota archaeon]HPO75325.1 anaerobic ribonucleoside-triphosphate reductase activating protein [Candidatus Pacearchaeota archaeon]
MIIASIQKQSLIEYPKKISAVIFLAGCNFRCQFCYVKDLVLPEEIKKIKPIPKKEVFSFLKKRKGFLDAVSITGGEATINTDLPEFIKKIKEIGYLVELETNGSNFGMLKNLVREKLVDYVAMDIKHNFVFEKWYEITGHILTQEMFENVQNSVNFLLEGKVDYEFRTTLVKEFHQKEDIIEICKKIKGAKIYFLQNFKETEGETLSGKKFTPFSREEIEEIVKEGKKYTNIQARPYL